MSLKEQVDIKKLPEHVAIIMDGNGRWAKRQGMMRAFGHQNGVKAVREAVECAAELGIKYLTLYAFSTENWSRSRFEVNALMELLVKSLTGETKTLMDNNIKLDTIGDIDALPGNVRSKLMETIRLTCHNTRLTLVLALSYSSKWEITMAVKNIARQVSEGALLHDAIDETTISKHLATASMPDPELLIRTSGEHRISNFLLWQIAYAEFYFTEKLWPEFDKEEFYKALIDYQQRDRRFGTAKDDA